MAIRVTQAAVEASIQPTDGQIRVTQAAVEASIQPTDGQIRVTQLAVEASIIVTFATQLLVMDDQALFQIPSSPRWNTLQAATEDSAPPIGSSIYEIVFIAT